MNLKRNTLIAFLLIVSFLTPACAPKVNTPGQKPAITGDQVLAGAKQFGQILAVALNQGIALEAELAANGTIEPTVEPKIRELLRQGKVAVDEFNVRVAGYTTFDATSKADIARLLDDSVAFISRVNSEGLLKIHNPKSQLIATGIISAAQVAIAVYRSTFEKVQ